MFRSSFSPVAPADLCRLPRRLLQVVSILSILLLAPAAPSTSQTLAALEENIKAIPLTTLPVLGDSLTCADYCSAGYLTMSVPTYSWACFSIDQGYYANVCLEVYLTFQTGGGCNEDATVVAGVYDQQGNHPSQNCVYPLEYQFTARDGKTTNACPNGQGVQCCCLGPGNYYIRILSNGADYSQCFSGYVKVCLDCHQGACP